MAVSSPSPPSRTKSANSTLFKTHRTASYSSSSPSFVARSTSPTRVSMCRRSLSPSPRSVRFGSPRRSISSPSASASASARNQSSGVFSSSKSSHQSKRTCMCSPTTHPGSFRCSLHKNSPRDSRDHAASYNSTRLNLRRSAMTNSLVRIGGVEGGDLVRRALSALIRPSSHHQRRRAAFKPQPSRLSAMSKAEDS
ncbi:serine-rich protein-like protein [Parasponia andersonii]|uniref:Serine-rich protein-like protein n=1 Tax=Parasponia andersonii TaxID=3476 RepID=A0A2P5BS74_PARAD|nr:serine-rich protein-like protein [Parasponia andersonii]